MTRPPKEVQDIYEAHVKRWRDLQPDMNFYRSLYMTEFWRKETKVTDGLVETARGYELVESVVASLFTKNPSVVVRPDLRNRGDAHTAQLITNEFLAARLTREALDDATRFALIYGAGFTKLYVREHPDPLQRVGATAVQPWNIIVDETSRAWEDQRYVAHIYPLPVKEAAKRFKKRGGGFAPRKMSYYCEGSERPGEADRGAEEVVFIVEFYDMAEDSLLIWSPDYKNGESYVSTGTKLKVGDETPEGEEPQEGAVQTFTKIPFRTASDYPIIPIIPTILTRDPDYPMRGYALMKRVADQLREFNLARTAQAQAIRRSARQWVTRKGALDDDASSKLVAGQDGEIIEVDVENGSDLRDVLVPVPHEEMRGELQSYANYVDTDIQRGTVMASFTRGEATNATATEVQALAAYTSSEVGRMARTRDASVEQMSRSYLSMVSVLLGDEPDVIYVNGASQVVHPEKLTADFILFAQEAGAVPESKETRRQQFMSALPLLQGLGVDPGKLLKQVISMFDLSEDLLPDKATGVEGTTSSAPATDSPPPEQVGAVGLQEQAAMPPSPENMDAILQ
jgi:hypothetical protein